jgi:hypothetical protein
MSSSSLLSHGTRRNLSNSSPISTDKKMLDLFMKEERNIIDGSTDYQLSEGLIQPIQDYESILLLESTKTPNYLRGLLFASQLNFLILQPK